MLYIKIMYIRLPIDVMYSHMLFFVLEICTDLCICLNEHDDLDYGPSPIGIIYITPPPCPGRMKKRELEMRLQKLHPMPAPDPALEQYATPASIAADVLFQAYGNGDIAGRSVIDLGCGNGIFAIGAWLLGAEKVIGVDVSENALSTSKVNIEMMEADIDLIHSDVRKFQGRADTVVMNPPFGSQRKGADRPFLDAAMAAAGSIYSLHMAETLPFLTGYARKNGRELSFHKEYKYDIPHLFTFHSKIKESIAIVMIIIR